MTDTPAAVEGVETMAWAVPAEGVTLDDLTLALSRAGTPILERDDANNRLLVGYDITGAPAPLHTYDESCTYCSSPANHIIPDGSHWCDLHLQGIRALLSRPEHSSRDVHELATEMWGNG
jgi:hypothetical protein